MSNQTSTLNFPILDDNDLFIVVVKPANLSVHCDQNITGFCALLIQQLGYPLYVVHRLDKMTSGVMVFAKEKQGASIFGNLFATRQVSKFYLALSDKKPKKKQGCIKGDMQKSRRGMWRLATSFDNPAVTQFYSAALGDKKRIFLLKPHTGKTHQLRVALKSIGAPIIGDPLYGSSASDRGYLHAWQLGFTIDGQEFNYRHDPDEGALFVSESIQSPLESWAAAADLPWPKG